MNDDDQADEPFGRMTSHIMLAERRRCTGIVAACALAGQPAEAVRLIDAGIEAADVPRMLTPAATTASARATGDFNELARQAWREQAAGTAARAAQPTH